MTLIMPRSTVEVEVYTRTQVQGAGIGSRTVNSGEEVALSCQVRLGNGKLFILHKTMITC